MGQKLGLSPRSSLIDIGAGAGWPGLYLSSISGCSVTLVDLPETGLKLAADRSIQDKISERVTTIVADAAELPFEDQSFDALSHSDLLCCLFSKEKVLIECRRIIREQGKMVFSVIYITPGLDKIDYERAVLNSPDFIQTDGEYETMLRECGWHIDEQIIYSKIDDYSINNNLENLGINLEEADGAQDIGYSSIFLFNDISSGYFGADDSPVCSKLSIPALSPNLISSGR